MLPRVDLPEPLGPMIACTSPAFTVRSRPRRIGGRSVARSFAAGRTCNPSTRKSVFTSAILRPFPNYPYRHRRNHFCMSTARGQAQRNGFATRAFAVTPARSSLTHATTLRPDVPDRWYHLMNRGADRQDVFSNDVDLVRVRELARRRRSVASASRSTRYCLMTNHFHLSLHCPIGGLSTSCSRRTSVHAVLQRALPSATVHCSVDASTRSTSRRTNSWPGCGRYVHRNPLAFVPTSRSRPIGGRARRLPRAAAAPPTG